MLLRELRKQRGLTMKELGEKIGVSESTISLYETGRRSPSYEILLKIAEYFGVSVDYLLRGNEEKTASQEADELLKDELVAFYGEVKDNLDQDDIDDLKTFMRMKAEIKKNRREKK